MKDFPRLLPVWLVLLLLILFMMCGCRGGRALGNGSAGTIIVPQTPQEINERSREIIELPPLEPLAPIPIVPPARKHTKSERSSPVIPEPQSAKANPVASNPKASGESTPFSPTVSTNLPTRLPSVKTEKLTPKIVEGGCVIITDSNGKPENQNESNAPEIAGPSEAAPKEAGLINWGELIYYWLFVVFMVIFGWIVYDIIQGFIKERKLIKKENQEAKKTQKKLIKKPAKGTRKSRKKSISKKEKDND